MSKERRSRSPLWAHHCTAPGLLAWKQTNLNLCRKSLSLNNPSRAPSRYLLCRSTVPSPSPTSPRTQCESQEVAKCPEFDPGSISTPSIHAPVDDTKTPQPPFLTQFTPSCGPSLFLDCRLNAADETIIIDALLRVPERLSGSSPSEPIGRVRTDYISQCLPHRPCHRIIQTTGTLITRTFNQLPVIGQTIPF